MADYYDRLEAQLAQATARRAPRRRLVPRLTTPRLRGDVLAVSFAVEVAVVVALVFIGVGANHQRGGPLHVGTHGPPVIRNYAPASAPPLGGTLVCNAALKAPRGGSAPTGTVVVNTRPPTRYVFSITASGMKPNTGGDVYAVWIRPEVQTTFGGYVPASGSTRELLGFIRPPVGGDGRLAAAGLLPKDVNSSYRLTITLQPNPSSKSSGRTVLEGDVVL